MYIQKTKKYNKKKINKKIIKIVFCIFEDMENVCYSVTNIALLLFPSILFPNTHPGLNFI